MIKKQGDLLEGFKNKEYDYIIHQCNCILLSHNCSGIAAKIFKEYPDAANANDKILTNNFTEEDVFGSFTVCPSGVINLYTQLFPGPPSIKVDSKDTFYKRMEALYNALKLLNTTIIGSSIGIPLIASGLARRKSNLSDLEYFETCIEPIIEETLTDVDVLIIHL